MPFSKLCIHKQKHMPYRCRPTLTRSRSSDKEPSNDNAPNRECRLHIQSSSDCRRRTNTMSPNSHTSAIISLIAALIAGLALPVGAGCREGFVLTPIGDLCRLVCAPVCRSNEVCVSASVGCSGDVSTMAPTEIEASEESTISSAEDMGGTSSTSSTNWTEESTSAEPTEATTETDGDDASTATTNGALYVMKAHRD